tara:strand:+ start:3226 stop:3771 length:546 start_codon:yes stop_codon:yes gene_type:complete
MAKKSKSRSRKSSKRSSRNNRGLATAAEGFVKKGYSVGQQLGDIEIGIEVWIGKISIVVCSIIFILVLLSLIYQIINVIYQKITGKGLCDIFNICSTPHNLIDKSKITSTSGSGSNAVTEIINYDKPNKAFILIGFTLLCLLIVGFAIFGIYFSLKINKIGQKSTAYRAVKGVQFVGHLFK